MYIMLRYICKSTGGKFLFGSKMPSGAPEDVFCHICVETFLLSINSTHQNFPRLCCTRQRGSHFGSAERAPSGCSVVSVDPVGLSAATSGYWVSAGGRS